MKKFLKVLNGIVSTVLMITLIGVAALVFINKASGGEPQVFGYELKTVLSGSMEPGIQTGSVIAVEPIEGEERNNLKVDDVITFMEEDGKLITHRIIEVNDTNNGAIYTTKGDNNNAPDSNPVLAENVVAKYNGFTIPYVGYIAEFSSSPNGIIALLIVPGFLLLGYSGFTVWSALRELDKVNKKPEVEVQKSS